MAHPEFENTNDAELERLLARNADKGAGVFLALTEYFLDFARRERAAFRYFRYLGQAAVTKSGHPAELRQDEPRTTTVRYPVIILTEAQADKHVLLELGYRDIPDKTAALPLLRVFDSSELREGVDYNEQEPEREFSRSEMLALSPFGTEMPQELTEWMLDRENWSAIQRQRAIQGEYIGWLERVGTALDVPRVFDLELRGSGDTWRPSVN